MKKTAFEQGSEWILCSAIDHNGTMISGRRHADCYKTLRSLIPGIKEEELPNRSKQGFLTSENRYVSRVEGYEIARDAKQLLLGDYQTPPYLLTSEDLFGCD